MLDGLFNYMVSGRQITSGKPHLGLGLYVVKLISQFHGGSIMAFNLNQPDGVLFRVQLPILIV
jgi:K+-sensing histidine kinase KdpD